MNNRFISNQYITQVEDSAKNNSPSNSGDSDSPTSALAKPPKIPSKIRRGAMGKRVISVPIKEVERLRLKGDHVSSPPSDSWAWRKYGQKPIKGSPYPRGYYRCSSSSKACPARKQVERSRENPNMLIVTYSCEHNHPPPSSRNTHHRAPPLAASGNSVSEEELEEEEEEEKNRDVLVRDQSKELISDNKFSMINGGDQFGWLTDFESPSSVILESPVLMEERRCTEREMAMIFSMGEDESGLFADLGELPECSTVFRRGVGLREAEQRRRSEAMCGP